MRLVSAFYGDWYPFIRLDHVFDSMYDTSNPDDLAPGDALIVWGGADIHPDLYGKSHSPQSGAGAKPSHRDKVEWALMQRAI